MNAYSVPVAMAAAITAYVGLYHFWLHLRRSSRSDFYFALSCACMTFYDWSAACAYNAQLPSSAALFQRLQVIGILMWAGPFVLLINEKSSIKTTPPVVALLLFFPLMGLFVAIDPLELLLESTAHLKIARAPWGEAQFFEYPPGPLQNGLELIIPLMIVYCFWVGFGLPQVREGRFVRKRKSSTPLLFAAGGIMLALLHDSTVTKLGWSSPYTFEFAWLGVMTFMSWSLSNELFEGLLARTSLEETEQRVTTTLNAIQDAVVTTNMKGEISHLNPAAERLLAVNSEAAVGHPFADFAEITSPETHTVVSDPVRFAVGRPTNPYGELPQLITRDGSERRIDLGGAPLKDPDGRVGGAIIVMRDLTLQHHALNSLEHAKKMESLGQLAGGTAHDLNNLLTPIISYVELIKRQVSQGSKEQRYLQHVEEAAQRAATLTKQLLALSRKQVLDVQVVPLAEFVRQTLPMIEHLVGEKIQIDARLDDRSGNVQIDWGQFEQVLLNLAANARDALADGGRLSIIVQRLRDERASIEVRDNGDGMDADTVSRIFEPFFTTKPRGKGTGLGLASVRGIVEQHGGSIYVDSEPGEGTSFEIVLPITHAEQPHSSSRSLPSGELARGTEHVLVVEDDGAVRALIFDALTQLGYTVHSADGITMALELARSEPIDVLLSDVVLPGTDGMRIREEVQALRDVPCLFMTGHADDRLGDHGFVPRGIEVLRKPFTVEQLGLKLRAVIQAPRRQ